MNESNDNAKLKKTHPNTGRGPKMGVQENSPFRIILTQSHFHYLSTVTLRGGNKKGTNSIEQQSEERRRRGLREERICLVFLFSLIIFQILIK